MNIFKNSELDEREFGRAAVRVDELCEWVKASRAMLPATLPDVSQFEAVQLECLLAAFSAAASDYEGKTMSDREVFAAAIAMLNEPDGKDVNPKLREMIEQERDVKPARWYVGGRVARHWRRKIEAAIAQGDLHTFDAFTGLPYAAAPSVQRHTVDKGEQRDEADVFIDTALELVRPAADTATVWSQLQKMAQEKSKPATFGTLRGFVPREGVQYEKNGQAAFLTRDALSKRLKRRALP